MTDDKWHIECLGCGYRFVYDDAIQVRHGRGYEWEDGDTLCPKCEMSLQDVGHKVHDGRVPHPRPLIPIEVLLERADRQAQRLGL